MLTLWVYSSPLWTHTTKFGNIPWGDVRCGVLCRGGFASFQQNNQESRQTNDECSFRGAARLWISIFQTEHVFAICSSLTLAHISCIYVFYLEGDAANRQVLVILQHAEILGHQGSGVDQTHRRLSVALPVVVFLRHVLQPGQTQVRRCLVALRYPEEGKRRRVL